MSFSFQDVLDTASDIVIVTEADIDPPGPAIVYVNEAFVRCTGYQKSEIIGLSPRILQGPDTDPQTTAEIREALSRGEGIHTTILNYAKNGRAYWLDIKIVPLFGPDGRITHFAGIERDMTERIALEARLRDLASSDALTGVPNRRHLYELAEQEIKRCQRYNRALSALVLDIDHFKRINDSFGHAAGDQAIRAVAEVCASSLRAADILGRVGGEEFAVFMPETPGVMALRVAERIRARIAGLTVAYEKLRFGVTASIGVSEFWPGRDSLETVLVRADQALYRAKFDGRDRVVLDPSPGAAAPRTPEAQSARAQNARTRNARVQGGTAATCAAAASKEP